MRASILCAVLALGGVPLLAQTPARSVNWDSLAAESVRNLSAYLAINTTNPPGHELVAARFFQELLAREGIEAQLLDTAELMTKGGDNLVEDGRLTYYGVGVAEKRAFWQRVTVHGFASPPRC